MPIHLAVPRYKFLTFIFFCYILLYPSLALTQVSPEEDTLEFHPSFSVSERYQDNVRREAYDNRKDDFSVRWQPGLDLRYNEDRHRHQLTYLSSFTRYHHLHEENTNTHNVALTNTLDLGERAVFNVVTSDGLTWEQKNPRFAQRRDNYLETNVFNVKPSLRINILEDTAVLGSYAYSRTSILTGDREDYLSNTFDGSLNQTIFDVVELFGGYRYTDQDFLENTPDFIDNVFFGGLNWDITTSLRLEGEYGFNIRKYEKETSLITDSTTENDTWNVTLGNDVTETTHVDISYSQSQAVRQITDTEQILRETFSASIKQILEDMLIITLTGSYSEEDYQFTDRRNITSNVNLLLATNFSEIISFNAGGGYGNNYFWPIVVRENVYTYQAGVSYRPLEWLTGSVDYQHIETDNNSPEGSAQFRTEYIQNSVSVTLTARF